MTPPGLKGTAAPRQDWQDLLLLPGILVENSPDDSLALWIPDEACDSLRDWERINATPRSQFTVAPNVFALVASSIRVRQRRGYLAPMWDRLRGRRSSPRWTLPGGQNAEQCSERRSGLLLVRGGETTTLEEKHVRTLWPAASRVRTIGNGVFLVEGASSPKAVGPAAPVEETGCPRQQAEQAAAAARAGKDPSPTVVVSHRAPWPRASGSETAGRGTDGDDAIPTSPGFVPRLPGGPCPSGQRAILDGASSDRVVEFGRLLRGV
jgi:hypothetical protein